ncbi:MAG: glutamine-hydrolyzing GMP synthase, partial [Candidatus Caldarchaeum sp.]|nr:glutamine-hydrolyzing GMP synthase [Candidatus Caldarchaeum sp.]
MKREDADIIALVDFGGQYAHLISRRIRELGVKTTVVPYAAFSETVFPEDVKGFVLSGGPASVYEPRSPRIPFDKLAGRPILGICYGHQLIAQEFKGRVRRAEKREFGRMEVKLVEECELFKGLPERFNVWMSHSDVVEQPALGFRTAASTISSPHAAIYDSARKIYGLQFHPEVAHTEHGQKILENFVFNVCGCRRSWSMENYLDTVVKEVAEQVGDGRVLCAVSGGVDSTVAAAIVSRAVGDRLKCLFVNHGLLREGEAEKVLDALRETVGESNVIYVDASERFLRKLRGVADPEEKRKIIGAEFAAIFEEVGQRHGPFTHLAQGTLYPDVVESGRSVGGSAVIKTHHNVGGLPQDIGLKVVEPLRELYKDEVRRLAELLGLPKWLVKRHPFPGPGLAVRVIGEVTEEKLDVCRRASAIVEEELERAGLLDEVWQAFAVVGDDKATGVKGDQRSLGYLVTVRVV